MLRLFRLKNIENNALKFLGIAVICIDVLIRLRMLSLPLERDEGEYALSAQRWLCGEGLYTTVYSMKWPGATFMYALFELLPGGEIECIRMGALIVHLITLIYIFLLAKKITANNFAFVAVVIWLSFLFVPLSQGMMANAEIFVNMFSIMGAYYYWQSFYYSKVSTAFFAGLFLGLSILMKQQALIICGLLSMGVIFLYWRKKNSSFFLQNISLLLVGVSLPFIICFTTLYFTSSWRSFYFFSFQYAAAYANHLHYQEGIKNFYYNFFEIYDGAKIIWWQLLAMLMVVIIAAKRDSFFMALWVIGCLIAVCIGWYFRSHYFQLLYPIAAIICAYGYSLLAKKTSAALLTLFLFLITSAVLIKHRDYLFQKNMQQATVQVYNGSPFEGSKEFSEKMNQLIAGGSTIGYFASEPQILYYSKMRACSGFIYQYPMMEQQIFAKQMLEEHFEATEKCNPEYMLVSDFSGDWSNEQTEKIFKTRFEILIKNYSAVLTLNKAANNCIEILKVQNESDIKAPSIVLYKKIRS